MDEAEVRRAIQHYVSSKTGTKPGEWVVKCFAKGRPLRAEAERAIPTLTDSVPIEAKVYWQAKRTEGAS